MSELSSFEAAKIFFAESALAPVPEDIFKTVYEMSETNLTCSLALQPDPSLVSRSLRKRLARPTTAWCEDTTPSTHASSAHTTEQQSAQEIKKKNADPDPWGSQEIGRTHQGAVFRIRISFTRIRIYSKMKMKI